MEKKNQLLPIIGVILIVVIIIIIAFAHYYSKRNWDHKTLPLFLKEYTIEQYHDILRNKGLGNLASLLASHILFDYPGTPTYTMYPFKSMVDVPKVQHNRVIPTHWQCYCHETHPILGLEIAPAIKNRLDLERIEVPPPLLQTIGVHLRCSDVPETQHMMYELIEFDWYSKALKLLMSSTPLRHVTLLACGGHNPSSTDFCTRYAAALSEHIERLGYTVQIDRSCGDPLHDFKRILQLPAFISGGCGGSYGFWAAALREGPSIVPCPKGPHYCELGADAMVTKGNKIILDAQRISNGIVRDFGGDYELNLCRTLSLAQPTNFDGTTYYINRDVATRRRVHCESMLPHVGLRPVRWRGVEEPGSAVGCCHSHLGLLRHIAASRTGWTLIVEDDVDFHVPDVTAAIMREIDAGAHRIFYLGLSAASITTDKLFSGRCTHAYVVTPDGAALLAAIIEYELTYNPKEHLDVIMEIHVATRVVGADIQTFVAADDQYIGIAYQARRASWYSQKEGRYK